MKRRNFIKNAGLASAALLAGPAFAMAGGRKKIGIQLYTVRDEMKSGLDAVLAKLSSVGYEQIEMYGYGDRKYFGNDMKTVAGLLKQYNLTSPSAHVGLTDFLHKGNDDALKITLEDAALIGNKYLVVPYLDANYRKNAEEYKQIAGRLNRAGELCQAGGLKFAYHNHAFEFDKVGDTTGYDILLRETDPKLVEMELDLFWAYNAKQDPLALFASHPGRFTMWHVKDMDKQDRNKQTEVGNGSIDFKMLFANQKKSGLKYFFVEQENYDVSPYHSIEQSIQYVKANLL